MAHYMIPHRCARYSAAYRYNLAFPRFDRFDRADGELGGAWEYNTGSWTISNGKAVAMPALGNELIANGDFSAWIDGNPDWWNVGGEAPPDPEVSQVGTGEGHGGIGIGKCNIYTSDGSNVYISKSGILTVGDWYSGTIGIDTVLAGSVKVWNAYFQVTAAYLTPGLKTYTFRQAVNQIFAIARRDYAGPNDVTFGDVSLKPIRLADMFATQDFRRANADISVNVTVAENAQAGIVMCLDSVDAPSNFIIAYHDGTNVVLEKCLDGAYSTLVSVAASYTDGKTLRLTKNGLELIVYYDNVQVGSVYKLDAVINVALLQSRRHGMFSTHPGNLFDRFEIKSPMRLIDPLEAIDVPYRELPVTAYKGNLHCHTTTSDGANTPAEMAVAYRDAGFDFVNFSDHDWAGTMTPAPTVEDIALFVGVEETCTQVTPGVPVESGECHVVTFDADAIDPSTVVQTVLDNAEFAYIAHPIGAWAPITADEIMTLTGCVAIGINSAEEILDAILSTGIVMYGMGEDDAHSVAEVGSRGWIWIFVDGLLTAETVMTALQTGKFYFSAGPKLIITDDGYRLTIESETDCDVSFIGKDGKSLGFVPRTKNAVYVYRPDDWYVRCRAKDMVTHKIACTNAVMFRRSR